MKFIKILVCSYLILISQFSAAQKRDTPDFYQIEHLYIWESGRIQIWLDSRADHGCPAGTESQPANNFPTRFIVESDDQFYNAKLALLMASRATKTPVSFRYVCNDEKTSLAIIKSIRS